MKTFKELRVWQASHELTLRIYAATGAFPSQEQFGLTSQLRRAVVSVAANIVEGHHRTSHRGLLNFLTIAVASLEEVKYLLLLARDLRYLTQQTFEGLASLGDSVGKMLYQFRCHVRQEIQHVVS